MASTSVLIVLMALAACALGSAVMTGPFYDTTALNSPNCNLPSPSGSTDICASHGVTKDELACADACRVNSSCTAYTWHKNVPEMAEWAGVCVFRTDNAWNPQSGAVNHVAGQKIDIKKLPWPINNGYDKLPVMWFGANASGLDNEDTLAVIAKHRVGGYGWQQGTGNLSPEGNLGRGEVHLASAATHLSDYLQSKGLNSTLVFVYRQIQVALRLFATDQLAADNPANDDFWLHDPATHKICLAGQPWGTSDPFWNFSNPDAAAYWLSHTIAEVTSERDVGVQAVFFDEVDQGYCGYWDGDRAGCPAQSADVQRVLQAANNKMIGQQVLQMNMGGVIPLLSLDNRMAHSSDGLALDPPCHLPEDDTVSAIAANNGTWARFYENWPGSFWVPDSWQLHAAMIYNAVLEGQAGVPQLIHAPAGRCPDPGRTIPRPGRLGGSLEYQLATFLIVQTPQSVFSASTDWYDNNFCWHPEYDVDYGHPLGPAVRTAPEAWYRNFTKCNVEVNVKNGVGQVYLL